MDCAWKANWDETKRRLCDWWNHTGLAVGGSAWAIGDAAEAHEVVEPVPQAGSVEQSYTDVEWRTRHNHRVLSQQCFGADVLPVANTDIGPGSLALFIGSKPGFSPQTVWFEPCMADDDEPENRPPLRFDPRNRWWKITEATLRRCAELGRGKYMVGCPDLIENIDILAALRGPQRLLADMIERAGWVSRKVAEINRVWFEAYERIYEIISLADGGAAFGAFRLWGPGRTAKVQCDASAMFSPEMFERFVVPALTAQCEWLDCSMFHLDGHQCIRHLDALLGIDALDAIEWTPDPRVPRGGDPCWYDLYRRILAAGKSVQAVGIKPHEIVPLLDAVGGRGMYILTTIESQAQAKSILKTVEPYRR